MSWSPETWGTSNPETGDANSPIGRFFQGAFGKHGATTGQLPEQLKWINGFAQNLAQGAPVDYRASTAAENAGVAGSGAMQRASTGTEAGSAAAWNAGLGGLGEGIATGFMPDVSQIDALLRPGVERSFASGAADLREQNALMGNLSSSGAGQQMVDYRTQLENNLNNATAGIVGQAMPTSMNIRSGMTQTGLALPGANAQSIWGPSMAGGLQGQQSVLDAINAAFGAIGASPYSAQQGSGGSGGGGAAASMLTKGCWVAEAIFGIDAPETNMARFYVNELAPVEFREWYLTYGQELAEKVKVDPVLREILRPLFLAFGEVATVAIAKG